MPLLRSVSWPPSPSSWSDAAWFLATRCHAASDYAIADDLRGRALALAPDDALVLGNAGLGFHNFQDDAEAALALAERSVALNPYSDRVLSMAAIIQRTRGKAEEATRLGARCFSLNPTSPKNAFVMESDGALPSTTAATLRR